MPEPATEPIRRPGEGPPTLPGPVRRVFRILTRPDEASEEGPGLTPEAVRGWVMSILAHALILLAMAFLYFAPKVDPRGRFDTRLAGSENGVEGGLETLGGLNTPIELVASPEFGTEPSLKALAPLELLSDVEKGANQTGAEKPSAGGGLNNPNPGAGDGEGFGLARFGQGGESIQGVEVKVGDPQFTLIWDTAVDLDLHVIEPGGKEIFWLEPNGNRGGELDVDNTKGYGPENIYWLDENSGEGEKVKGRGPQGAYQWFVVYWGGLGGVPRPTNWKVRVKHDGKTTVFTGRFRELNERSRTRTLHVGPKATAAQ